MARKDTRSPFFLAWREELGLSHDAFWPRYGVRAGVGARYERSVNSMPRMLMLLVALHRVGRVSEADLAWAAEGGDGLAARIGRWCLDLRLRLGLKQTGLWARFAISQPTGGRYERGRNILPAARLMLTLYRGGRIDDDALAEGRRWLAAQTLSHAVTGEVSEADARPDDMYAIRRMYSRVDGEPGYLVKVGRRLEEHTCWFGVGRYGSELKALAAAQRWRDEVIAEMRPMSKREFVSMVRRNNTSGVAGVQRVVRTFPRASGGTTEYVAWAIRPPRCLKVSGRSFRVDEYGEEGARERAIALRRQFEARVEGFHAPNVPDAFLPDSESHGALGPTDAAEE